MESVLSPDIPNVAKIVIDGEKIIRAYGSFPHPNVFSGFLILSIFCGFWLLITYKPSFFTKIVSRETIFSSRAAKFCIAFLLIFGTLLQIFAFIVTYSRSGWLAFTIAIVVSLILLVKLKLFHVKQLISFTENKIFLVIILCVFFLIFFVLSANWKPIVNRIYDNGSNSYESMNNRVLYNDIAHSIINKHLLYGTGGMSFTLNMQKFYSNKLQKWQFQPVHNIYLLIASEQGIIGLAIFLILIYAAIKASWPVTIKEIAPSVIETAFLSTENNHYPARANQIDSHLPAATYSFETKKNVNLNKNIVSRETILAQAQEGKTILIGKEDKQIVIFKVCLISVLIGFMFIGLLDHYFWTLQQGQLIFWIVLGSMLGTSKDFCKIVSRETILQKYTLSMLLTSYTHIHKSCGHIDIN